MTTATQVSERNSLRLMCLAGFASMASMRMCDPMLLELGQEFQVSTGEASSVVSAFAVAYGVLQLFYGPLGDRFGKQRVISLAVLVCAVLSGITAMASNLTVLVLMRAAMGAAAAGIIPLSMAWVGDHVTYERRQETLAKLMGATVTGMMVGLWFGGFAAETLGWRTAFVAMSGMFAVAGCFVAQAMEPPAVFGRSARQQFGCLFGQYLEALVGTTRAASVVRDSHRGGIGVRHHGLYAHPFASALRFDRGGRRLGHDALRRGGLAL